MSSYLCTLLIELVRIFVGFCFGVSNNFDIL
jgi:hypothetical protein